MSEKNNDDLVRETAGNRIYTYGDYLKWDDDQRYELIDGKVYLMSPAPYRRHQKVSGELFRQIANYLVDKHCEVYEAPFDVRLPEGKESEKDILNVVQPDIVVVCDQDRLDKKGAIGAPDLVIEILSPSSEKRDRKIKLKLYERQGVREYWLVDYNTKEVEVYVLVDRDDMNGFKEPIIYTENEKVPVGIFKNLQIDLSYVFREKMVKEKAVDYQYGGRKVSYEEFMNIYEKSSLRMEFINGEITVLASPVIGHQEVLGRLYIIFNDYFKGKKCRMFLAPFDVHFNKKGFKEPDVMQPDLLVACDLEDNVNEKERYMGTPTLVIEVLSDSTKDKDMIKKLNTYKLSGVEEYWIVDYKQKNIMVYHFENLEVDKYKIYGKTDTALSDVFDGLSVNIEDLFNELI